MWLQELQRSASKQQQQQEDRGDMPMALMQELANTLGNLDEGGMNGEHPSWHKNWNVDDFRHCRSICLSPGPPQRTLLSISAAGGFRLTQIVFSAA